jgi:hypothetical protein
MNAPVDGNVQPHEFNEGRVVTKTKQRGKVVRIVLLHVNRWELTATVDIAVNAAGNVWQFGDPGIHVLCKNVNGSILNHFSQVHRVIERWGPIFLFGDTLGISLGKCRVVIELHQGM